MAKEKKKENNKPNEPKAASENGVAGKKTGDVLTLKKELELKALARAEKAGKFKWLNAGPKIRKKLTEHTAYKYKNSIKSKARRAVYVKKFTLLYEEVFSVRAFETQSRDLLMDTPGLTWNR